MPNDFTTWPTVANVWEILNAQGVTSRSDINSLRVASVIAAVEAEVGIKTLRQFVADAVDTTRTYDGNGTAEIEIDEYVSITSMLQLGYNGDPGFPLVNFVPVKENFKPMTRVVRAIGSVPAFVTSGIYSPYAAIFPAGRQNIFVTGRFGFGPTIPADLWSAVAGEAAYRIVQDSLFVATGRLVEWQEGEQREKYDLSTSLVNRLHEEFRAALKTYKRPDGRRLRNMAPRMI